MARDWNALRAVLEAAVIDAHGSVSLSAAATIQAIGRHERTVALASKWLRDEGATIPPIDRLEFLRIIEAATAARDKAIKALRIDQTSGKADPWAALARPADGGPRV